MPGTTSPPPPLMMLPNIRRHGSHSEYLLLQAHCSKTLLIHWTEFDCFLVASCKESGAWLHGLPISSLGLCMDDATVRISMGLRLRLPLYRSHTFQHCGAEVSQFATHGLSCRKSATAPPPPFSCQRHHTQSFSCSTCSITSGAFRSVSLRWKVTWRVNSPLECSRLLAWDATCPDTFVSSYTTIAAQQVEAVAQQAADKRVQIYKHLDSCYFSLQ